jgi:hypothetical protein
MGIAFCMILAECSSWLDVYGEKLELIAADGTTIR